MIKPGLRELDLKLDQPSLQKAAVEANVRLSMRQLSTSPEGARALREKRVGLAGGVYEAGDRARSFSLGGELEGTCLCTSV